MRKTKMISKIDIEALRIKILMNKINICLEKRHLLFKKNFSSLS